MVVAGACLAFKPPAATSQMRVYSFTAALWIAAPCVFLIFKVLSHNLPLGGAQAVARAWLERVGAGAAVTVGVAYLLPCARQVQAGMAIRCYIIACLSTLLVYAVATLLNKQEVWIAVLS